MSIHETHHSDQDLEHHQYSEAHIYYPNCLLRIPREDHGPRLYSYHVFVSRNNSFVLPGFELLKNVVILHVILFFFVRFNHVIVRITSLFICCYVILLMDIFAVSGLCIFHALV